MPTFADKQADHRCHRMGQPVGQEGKRIEQHGIVKGREDVLEILDDTSAQKRTNQRTDTAKDRDQNDLARCGPLHALGTGQRIGYRQKRTGKTGIHARNDKGSHQVWTGAEPGITHAVLVRLDRAQLKPER